MQREEIKSQTKISKLVPPCSPTSISSDWWKEWGWFWIFHESPYCLVRACPLASAGRFLCTRFTSHSSSELPKEAFLPVTHTSLNNCLVHSFPKVTIQYLPTGRIYLNLTCHQNVSVLFKLQVKAERQRSFCQIEELFITLLFLAFLTCTSAHLHTGTCVYSLYTLF